MTEPVKLDLAAIRVRAEAATLAEWIVSSIDSDGDAAVGVKLPFGHGRISCIICEIEDRDKDRKTVPSMALAIDDAAHIATMDPPTTIALLDMVERLTRERDEAREVVAFVNNSFGSHSYFITPHPAEQVENLKAYSGEQWCRAEVAEAKIAKLEARIHALVDAAS